MTKVRGTAKRIDQMADSLPERALIALARYKADGLVLRSDYGLYARVVEHNLKAMEADDAIQAPD